MIGKMVIKFLRGLFKKKYKIIIETGNDQEMLKKIYQFRYRLYCLVDKLLPKEDYPDEMESDEYDQYSTYFLAVNSKNEILGIARIIRNSNLGLPTIHEFKLENKLNEYDLNKMVEISRLMVIPEYRDTFLLYDLYRGMYLYSKDHKIKYWHGCVEQWFMESIKKITSLIKNVGEPIFCFNAMNYPFVINISEIEAEIKKKNFIFYKILTYKSKKFNF